MPNDEEFLRHVETIQGWLDPFAALRTVELLNFQRSLALTGPVYEIGVFWGKYFAILARDAFLSGDKAIGFDVFLYNKKEDLEKGFETTASVISDEKRDFYGFVEANSTDLSDIEIGRETGGKARFISIDGSHEHDQTFWDLTMAERMLLPYGVIAADDFMNVTCIGANEAINRFLSTNANVAPFALCHNKLLICRPAWRERYKNAMEACAMNDISTEKGRWFQDNVRNNTRFNIETRFHGYPTLLLY